MGKGVGNSRGCRRRSQDEPGVGTNQKGSLGDIPVPPVMEEIMAVVQEEEKLIPQERVQQPTVERAPVPQILEETVEVALMERVQRRTVD